MAGHRPAISFGRHHFSAVMAGLDPAIHETSRRMRAVRFPALRFIMDARVKPAHDAECVAPLRLRSRFTCQTAHEANARLR
jgi:hypothetical protein